MRQDPALSTTPQASTSTHAKAESSRRSPAGGLRRMVTRHAAPLPASSFLPTTVRPEARRAYDVEEMDSWSQPQPSAERHTLDSKSNPVVDPSTDSTCLLQQAANYASLAFGQSASGSDASSSRLSVSTVPDDSRLAPPISVASSAVRRLLDFSNTGHRRQSSSSSTVDEGATEALRIAGGITIPAFERISADGEAWETAPRLSMSSTASSGASEVKTPESVNSDLNWQTYRSNDAVDFGNSEGLEPTEFAHAHASQRAPRSPGLIDMKHAMRDPDGLSAMGLDAAQCATRSSVNLALIDAARHMGDEELEQRWSPYGLNDEACVPAAATLASRSATIKAKRPDTLLRLPSISYRTDATVTPPRLCSPAVEGGPSNAKGVDATNGQRERNPWDISSIVDSVKLDADEDGFSSGVGIPTEVRRSSSAEKSPPPTHPLTFASKFDRVKQRADSNDSVGPPNSVVSSDSWRSLLPEDDPYFVPDPSSASSSSITFH